MDKEEKLKRDIEMSSSQTFHSWFKDQCDEKGYPKIDVNITNEKAKESK